jgi:AcrR family transcriptional regulator
MAANPTEASARSVMSDNILEAAEDLLRRHGPQKTNVVDVARHLGMSHANVYRHFENKAAIQDAVAARWLRRIAAPLEEIVSEPGSAEARLRRWVSRLVEIKLQSIKDDPELFATYNALAEASRKVIDEHVAHLRAQLAVIITDGVTSDEFKVANVPAAAQAIHEGVTRFQHPFFVTRPEKHSDGVNVVMDLLIAGLKAGAV